MIAYETRLGKIDISEAYLSKLIGHEVLAASALSEWFRAAAAKSCLTDFQKPTVRIPEFASQATRILYP